MEWSHDFVSPEGDRAREDFLLFEEDYYAQVAPLSIDSPTALLTELIHWIADNRTSSVRAGVTFYGILSVVPSRLYPVPPQKEVLSLVKALVKISKSLPKDTWCGEIDVSWLFDLSTSKKAAPFKVLNRDILFTLCDAAGEVARALSNYVAASQKILSLFRATNMSALTSQLYGYSQNLYGLLRENLNKVRNAKARPDYDVLVIQPLQQYEQLSYNTCRTILSDIQTTHYVDYKAKVEQLIQSRFPVQQASLQFIENLTEAERYLCYLWSRRHNDFQDRETLVMNQAQQSELEQLFLRAPRLNTDWVIFRGWDLEDKSQLVTESNKFLAATYSVSVASDFVGKCCLTAITVPAGTPILLLEELSRFPGECEVLLPSHYRLAEVRSEQLPDSFVYRYHLSPMFNNDNAIQSQLEESRDKRHAADRHEVISAHNTEVSKLRDIFLSNMASVRREFGAQNNATRNARFEFYRKVFADVDFASHMVFGFSINDDIQVRKSHVMLVFSHVIKQMSKDTNPVHHGLFSWMSFPSHWSDCRREINSALRNEFVSPLNMKAVEE